MDIKTVLALLCLCLLPAGPACSDKPANKNTQTAAGGFHSVCIKDDGSVWTWGLNAWGQLANGRMGGLDGWRENTSIPAPAKDAAGNKLSGIVFIAAGYHHTVALKKDGTLLAWGANSYGQLSDDTRDDRPLPVQVKGANGKGFLADIVKIAAGYHYTAAVKKDGTVWIWGHNGSGMWGQGGGGQLGDGTDGKGENRFILTPVQVKGPGGKGYLSDVKDIAGCARHTVALKKDGTIWAWGSNGSGQLGDGTTSNNFFPVQVKGPGGQGYLTGIKAVAAGVAYSVVLAEDGGVLAWGNNHFGQLGDGSTNNSLLPVRVKAPSGTGELKGAAAISAGSRHILALTGEGTVLAWGFNGSGQLGDGTLLSRSVPAPVSGPNTNILSDVSGISAGYEHSLALKKNGLLLAWGGNSAGQLGSADKTTLDAVTPVFVREPPAPPVVTFGEGRWLWEGTPLFRPGLSLDVTAKDGGMLRALRHCITTPTMPERGGLAFARETEMTMLEFTPVSNGCLTVSFDLRVSSAASRTLDLKLLPAANDREAWFMVWGKAPDKLNVRNTDVADLDAEWHHYDIVSDLGARTYDVLLDGKQACKANKFRYDSNTQPPGTPFGRLQIGTTHGDSMIRGTNAVVDGAYADIANIRISNRNLNDSTAK
jgi:alpha-tubulin suppressor-like RCC1 family protein